MKYEGLSHRESGMSVNGLGPFIFGDTIGIFVILKCFPGAKRQFVSLCFCWEVKSAVQHLTVGQTVVGVVIFCVTDDIPLRICVYVRAHAVQQDVFSCPELCFFLAVNLVICS
jgi:hypothetical protein